MSSLTKSIELNNAGRSLKNRITRLDESRTFLTKPMFNLMKSMYEYECAYCNTKEDISKSSTILTKEHVVTNKHNGTLEWANIIPVCKSCNENKRETDWLPFAHKKNSRHIDKIKEQIKGYVPLMPMQYYKNHTSKKFIKAFALYESRIKRIEEKYKAI